MDEFLIYRIIEKTLKNDESGVVAYSEKLFDSVFKDNASITKENFLNGIHGYFHPEDSGWATMDSSNYQYKDGEKRTLVVNLFGGPCVGKSTLMAHLYYKLKIAGVEVEMATEYAKDLVWEERYKCFDEQIYIFAKQYHRIHRLIGKVDVVICDSPLFNSIVYSKENNPDFDTLIKTEFSKFNNFNILVERNTEYNPNGRNETAEQALVVDEKINDILRDVNHYIIKGQTAETIDSLVDEIMQCSRMLYYPKDITIVAAVADNNAIGYDGDLIYHIKKDMKNFRNTTIGRTIVMGLNTYKSFSNGALPKRRNIVLSHSVKELPDAEVYNNIEDVLFACKDEKEIFIIGGATIYKLFIPICTRLILTEIHDNPENADTFFPEYNKEDFSIEYYRSGITEDNIEYAFNYYRRVPKKVIDLRE